MPLLLTVSSEGDRAVGFRNNSDTCPKAVAPQGFRKVNLSNRVYTTSSAEGTL